METLNSLNWNQTKIVSCCCFFRFWNIYNNTYNLLAKVCATQNSNGNQAIGGGKKEKQQNGIGNERNGKG